MSPLSAPLGEKRGTDSFLPRLFAMVVHEAVDGPAGVEFLGPFADSVSSRERTADFLRRTSLKSPSIVWSSDLRRDSSSPLMAGVSGAILWKEK